MHSDPGISPTSLLNLLPEELDAFFDGWGWPAFRAQQFRQWVYQKAVLNASQMTNLAKRDREQLDKEAQIATGQIIRRQDSSDGTIKLLIGWGDKSAETVMIPDNDRRTACVSSQFGCPVGCKFCASGLDGVKGNLTPGQIIEQVLRLNEILAPRQESINHVVFMGMGEPMANYQQVMKAVRILHDPQCLNISARKITISTVGVPARMRDLAKEELPLNLAISLHAPNETLRRTLIPWAEHFALGDILDAARFYFDQTGREITLEYILLSGVNDQPAHARELARLCKTLRANVNLIRYNQVEALEFRRPLAVAVVEFQRILREAGVNCHTRKSRGRDIDAACGQLRRKEPPTTTVVTPTIGGH